MSNVEMNLIYKHSTKGETKLAFGDNEGLLQYFQEEAPFLENWLNSIKKTIKPEYATDVNSLIKKCQDVQNRQAQAMESCCKQLNNRGVSKPPAKRRTSNEESKCNKKCNSRS